MAKELYVGHISDNVTEDDVRKLFSVMGNVKSVRLIIDPETGEFKKCGYVLMAADIDLKEVVDSLDGALLIDRVITVSVARPKTPGKSGKFGKPDRYGMSGKSVKTDNSARPNRYAKPDKPTRTEKPAKRDKPARPDKSSVPSRLDKPASGRKFGRDTRPGKDRK